MPWFSTRFPGALALATALVLGFPSAGSALSHQWSFGAGGPQGEHGHALAVDAGGSIFLGGAFVDSLDLGGGTLVTQGGWDVFLAKFDPAGNHLWSRSFSPNRLSGMVVTPSGGIVVCGSFSGTADFGGGPLVSAGGVDLYLVEFDGAGNHVWSRAYGGTSRDDSGDLARDALGNLYVAGHSEGTLDFGGGPLTSAGDADVFVVKLDSLGTHIWSHRFGDAAAQYATALAVDYPTGIVLIGGNLGTVNFGGGLLITTGAVDAFLVKFDLGGNHLWSRQFGDGAEQSPRDVGVDGAGNVALACLISGTIDFGGGPLTAVDAYDIGLAKFDGSGNHLWSHAYGSYNVQSPRAVAFDRAGNLLLTGYMSGFADFGGGAIYTSWAQVFLVQLDPGGSQLTSSLFGSQNSAGYDVISDPWGSVILTGAFNIGIDFGGGLIPGHSYDDVFLAKFTPLTTGAANPTPTPQVVLAPNPARSSVTISFALGEPGLVEAAVFDVRGRRIAVLAETELQEGNHTLRWDRQGPDSRPVPPGVYFVRLSAPEFDTSRKLVILEN